jgi:multidrug efflux pump subunit AcrA (membrane-fusion protein)
MKKRLIFTILLIIAGYAGYFYYTHLPQKVADKLTLFGNVEIRHVDMGFRVEGKIQNMFFEEGDYVKKGQVMGVMYSSDASSLAEAMTHFQSNYQIGKEKPQPKSLILKRIP